MDHQSEMCATSQEKFRPELRALRKLYGGDTRDARRKAAVLFCGCFVRLRLFRLRRLGLPELLRMKAPSRRLRKRRAPRGCGVISMIARRRFWPSREFSTWIRR